MDAFSSPEAADFSNFWAPVLDSPAEEYKSNSEVSFVASALPTAAGSTESYELVGNDLALLFSVIPFHPLRTQWAGLATDPFGFIGFGAQVKNAIVVPDLIDLERFKLALAQTVSAFPDLAGRLRHDSTTNVISVRILLLCGNRPIPANMRLIDPIIYVDPSDEFPSSYLHRQQPQDSFS